MMVYIIGAVLVLIFSGVLAMAGLGAAFLFVPLFYYLGVPLDQATPTALLLNVVSLLFATITYWRGGLINWRVGIPVLVTAVLLSPLGAWLTPLVNQTVLLALFAAFLVFAGAVMLFYRAKARKSPIHRNMEIGVGGVVGGAAGFLGGLLGVGGGNFILPVLNWFGLDAKVAAGTTALVVVFSSLAGFLGHATLSHLDPLFLGLMALMAAIGSFIGSHLMKTKLSNRQLKPIIGMLLWVIAAKMLIDVFL
jgi:uncharacterized membrane protein YfcA